MFLNYVCMSKAFTILYEAETKPWVVSFKKFSTNVCFANKFNHRKGYNIIFIDFF